MIKRKTIRRKKGSGWGQALFGMKPSPASDWDWFKASNGVLISRSKSYKRPIYSKDNGKTWDYLFEYEDIRRVDPFDEEGNVAYREYKQKSRQRLELQTKLYYMEIAKILGLPESATEDQIEHAIIRNAGYYDIPPNEFNQIIDTVMKHGAVMTDIKPKGGKKHTLKRRRQKHLK